VRDDPLAATAQLLATLPHIALQMAASGEMEKKIKAIGDDIAVVKGDIADVKRQMEAPNLDASVRTLLMQKEIALQQQLGALQQRLNRLEEQAAGEGAFILCGIQGRAPL
jgi:hypothetical protein